MFDSSEGVSPTELDLARKVISEGRVLIAVGNKWDKVQKDLRPKFVDYYTDIFFRKISLKGLHIVLASAHTKYNVNNLLRDVINLYDSWNIRIGTGLLNRWLDSFKKVQNLPSEHGSLLKIKYITQIKARPPTFYVFVNDKSLMKENYYKNFSNSLCAEFKLSGVPVRIIFRDKHLKAKRIHKPGFNLKRAKDFGTSGFEKVKGKKNNFK
jgi:GTP-binding protein